MIYLVGFIAWLNACWSDGFAFLMKSMRCPPLIQTSTLSFGFWDMMKEK